MDVADAIESRFTCRAFLPEPVPRATVREILTLASRAPSGGNLQPWRVWALTGGVLDRLRAEVREHTARGQFFEGGVDYAIYPQPLKEPYATRRFHNGEGLYGAMGIARDDAEGRMRQMAANFELFGAPVGLFIAVDRQMGPPQWADLGIFLQTLMLAARGKGLDTAAQEAWSLWPKLVGRFLELPDELMLFCGVALGRADRSATANHYKAERARIDEFVRFRGFEV